MMLRNKMNEHLPKTLFRGIGTLLLFALSVSCESVYFYEPIPHSSANLETFPKALRGVWKGEDEASDSCIITKYTYAYYDVTNFSMPFQELDTMKDVQIIGDRIFHYDSLENRLEHFRFSPKGDSCIIYGADVYYGQLDSNHLLRKSESAYILNERENNFWKVYRLEFLPKRKLQISIPLREDFNTRTDFSEYCLGEKTEKRIIVSRWNAAQIEKFAREGGFSSTLSSFYRVRKK